MSGVEQGVISFVSKWWTTTFVLGSLTTQIVLLLTGGTRKWNSVCRIVAWNAYNASDYIATTALASLAQSVSPDKAVYALWAPILLLHLGGPDNICAYARADSALWLRHGLTMILQALAAVYVIANCARGEKFIAVSACLAIVGTIKYAERTLALKCASQEDIVKSSQSIYSYMLGEFMLRDTEALLPVRGDKGDGVSLSPVRRGGDGNPRYYYILRGEENWHRNFEKGGSTNTQEGFQSAYTDTPELVTLNDILCSEVLNPRSIDPEATSPFLLWCLGYALFKMYKRRLCTLYMYEWRQEKTRQLFVDRHNILKSEEDVFYVIDVELRFLFDSLYSKAAGTAYTKRGALLRLITTTLLAVSGIFVFRLIDFKDQDRVVFQAKAITLVLLVAALAIELYQLVRLVSSDWTRVRLSCMYIVIGRKRSFYRFFCLALLRKSMDIIGSMRRTNYWRNRIGQYSMVLEPREKRISLCGGILFKRVFPQHEESIEAVAAFKRYLLQKVLTFSREMSRRDWGSVRSLISDPGWYRHKYQNQANIVAASFGAKPGATQYYFDLEHLIATWHVATSICELLVPGREAARGAVLSQEGDEALDYQMSMYLSRYTTYLLVHKTELLPCHADIGRRVATSTERDLKKLAWTETEMRGLVMNDAREISGNLHDGMCLAKQLLQEMPNNQQRWSLIANVWTDILIHIAAANKGVQEHLEQLTKGGELLTHLWVLLGHMGYGQQ